MSTALDDVRVEVAFDANPDNETPSFRDLTSRARLDIGITTTRGRGEQFDVPQPGRSNLTFDNDDGALTPGLATSPFYPNVKVQNRVRETYRDSSVAANFLDAESATFEGGTVGGWAGSSGAAVANSNLRAASGARSMLVTWPTAAANASGAGWVLTGNPLVIGREYTVTARVWVPAGSPPVRIAFIWLLFPFYSSSSGATTGAWVTLTGTFQAAASNLNLAIRPASASTAGQQVWVDEIRVDEAVAPSTFSTTPISDVIVSRFDGHVHEWPTAWPGGGANASTTAVTAYDVTSRLARTRKLGSVIAETYRLQSPSWHFPLDEPSGSVSVGERTNTGAVLELRQAGTGGAIEFAGRTGAPTDGASAPDFAPVDPDNGRYLSGEVPRTTAWTNGLALEATFITQVGAAQTIARITDPSGPYVELAVDSSGRAVAKFYNPWVTSVSVTSSAVVADGRTHVVAATISIGAGLTKTLRLWLDGESQGPVNFDDFIYLPNLSTLLSVGGVAGGRCFAGAICHVAAFGTSLGTTLLGNHYTANVTGFAGERSDQRIARVLSWVGFPTSRQVLDVGLTKVGHIDPSGRDPMSILNDVGTTEGGIVFADTWGRLTFHGRGRRYQVAQPVSFSATGDDLEPDTEATNSVDDLATAATVSRSGGATARAEDAASILVNGVVEKTAEIFADSDLEAFARAQWMVALGANPTSRLPTLGLDALTATPAARSLELGQRGSVTGLPPQLPTTAGDVIVEGYTETISRGSGWVVKANTGPFMPVRPLILDDPTYGVLDSTNSLVY